MWPAKDRPYLGTHITISCNFFLSLLLLLFYSIAMYVQHIYNKRMVGLCCKKKRSFEWNARYVCDWVRETVDHCSFALGLLWYTHSLLSSNTNRSISLNSYGRIHFAVHSIAWTNLFKIVICSAVPYAERETISDFYYTHFKSTFNNSFHRLFMLFTWNNSDKELTASHWIENDSNECKTEDSRQNDREREGHTQANKISRNTLAKCHKMHNYKIMNGTIPSNDSRFAHLLICKL